MCVEMMGRLNMKWYSSNLRLKLLQFFFLCTSSPNASVFLFAEKDTFNNFAIFSESQTLERRHQIFHHRQYKTDIQV